MSDLHARYAASLMNTFGPPKLVLTRGEGARVWDEDGNSYVDLLGGIAVNALGHGHPALVEAVTTQLSTLGHVSNFFATQPQVELAERLLALLDSGPGKVFFANSGAEANEAAIKLTRRTGRTHLVATEGAFHGRTMGALALTAKEAYREPFEPLPGHVTFVPFGDVAALEAAVTDETAAVVLEPVQGEAGVVMPPAGYLAAARRVSHEHGALLWLDEVQSGVGRTGAWFAHRNAAVDPTLADEPVVADVVTLAKGLGGGIPIGACVALGDAADLLGPGNHGTTFGGNPVATAAGLAVLATIETEGLLDHVTKLGERLRTGLAADPRVTEVRGAGLLIGLDLIGPRSAEVAAAALEAGYIINNPTPERIRLAPPLVLTDADADAFVAAWPTILDAAGLDESGPAAGAQG
jgi:acetylornithine aminotransferase